jgi:hypothetical protein
MIMGGVAYFRGTGVVRMLRALKPGSGASDAVPPLLAGTSHPTRAYAPSHELWAKRRPEPSHIGAGQNGHGRRVPGVNYCRLNCFNLSTSKCTVVDGLSQAARLG